jgi:hypothetical protein
LREKKIMTEFEMASLLNDEMGVAGNQFMNWISMVTAFVAIGYLISHRLSPWMITATVLVYSYIYIGMVRPMFLMIGDIQGLLRKMESLAATGSGFEWHSVKSGALPAQWLWDVEGYVNVAAFALVYLATIVFFLQIRRMNRKAEAEPPKTTA